MFARLKNGQTTKYNSSLSEFVRNADSSKKKKVYSRVIDRAVESQNSVVKQAELLQTRWYSRESDTPSIVLSLLCY